MKLTEFKKLIREEVRKLIAESVIENKTVNAESDIIEKIKKLLPHMHQKDADHNAKVMLNQYKDGTLKSGVIYNQIKKLMAESVIEIGAKVKIISPELESFNKIGEVQDQAPSGKFYMVKLKTGLAYFHESDLRVVK